MPLGCPLPGILVVNMQVPRDSPCMFGQSLDGPSTNIILYFGLKEETLALLQQPESERPNALTLLIKYWREFSSDRKLQETLKLIALCKNVETLGGVAKMFSSYNGKPVLVTRSGTVYKGEQNGVVYGGVDINFRCWAYPARQALVTLVDLIPEMDIQVGFTIEGDHKKKGGEKEKELPECLFGTCLCNHVPNVFGQEIMTEADFFS